MILAEIWVAGVEKDSGEAKREPTITFAPRTDVTATGLLIDRAHKLPQLGSDAWK